MHGAPTSDATGNFDSVELREVSRHFGRRRALLRVSLTCHGGRTVGLLGPNGAGKSTLLGVLATSIRPTSGDVTYGGRTAAAWGDSLRGRIGVLGHDLFLYGELTARENLAFFGRLYGLPDLDARIDEALDLARLGDRADDRVGAFSRGLRQRLALERALLHRPRLVLLDEPFTGLDDQSTALLIGRLRALRDAGTVVVMATHDFENADDIVDEPVCLREGRLVPIRHGGAPLRERYRQALEASRT